MKTTAHAHLEKTRAVRLATVTLAGASLALLAGCASDPIVPVPPPAAPPQQTVVVQPAPTQIIGTAPMAGGGTIVVTQAPPVQQQQQQVISGRPSADHVWVEGWWVWRDGRYVWRQGEWVIPPRVGAVWHPPRWERRSDGWALVEGFWR
jgi:hypothetical protein